MPKFPPTHYPSGRPISKRIRKGLKKELMNVKKIKKFVLQKKKNGRWVTLRGFGVSYNKETAWRDWKLTRQRLLDSPLTDKGKIKKRFAKKNFRVKQIYPRKR